MKKKIILETKIGVDKVAQVIFGRIWVFPVVEHVFKFGWCYLDGRIEGLGGVGFVP